MRPDKLAYKKVLVAWAKISHCDAAKRAKTILRRMEALAKDGNKNAWPDGFSYKTLLLASSRSETGAEEAEALLDFYGKEVLRRSFFLQARSVVLQGGCSRLEIHKTTRKRRTTW